MDIRRIIITAMIYVAAMAHAAAQNRIDGMMENYSSHGMSKYTSAVERDPQTRKVRRVVNVLHSGVSRRAGTSRRNATRTV